MIFLSGADLVLPHRMVPGGTLVIDGDRIIDIVDGPRRGGSSDQHFDLTGHVVVPGFIDGHVHGVAGHDVLDGPGAVAAVANAMPKWGVTAFCPTSIACEPGRLETFLAEVARLASEPARMRARVLPAHLESNFISPDYRGAQPAGCLRVPSDTSAANPGQAGAFTARDILLAIDRHRAAVGIVTLASEIDGGLALVRAFAAAGVRVSLGHSGATFEQALEAISAGATRATHLFNRMSPMSHRDPGLVGAVLASDAVAVELVGDGHHVHPSVMRVAIRAKGPRRTLAITDGTAGSGLPAGSRTQLGGYGATVHEVARLDDGTIAGSVVTMDRVLAVLVSTVGLKLVEAVEMCSAAPARELGLQGQGVLNPGAVADVVVLTTAFQVVETWIAGSRVYSQQNLQ